MADPAIVEAIAAAVGRRRAELDEHRSTQSAVAVDSPDARYSFVARVRKFLRLSSV
jgi:hypothetical protein